MYGTRMTRTTTSVAIGGNPPTSKRRRRAEQRECDDRLDRERRAPGPHGPRDDRAHSDHRGEVERVRAEHDAEADIALAAEDRRDRGRELRTVGGDRREDPEQRLGEAEPHTDTVEPVGEHRGRDQRHAKGEKEADCGEGDMKRGHGRSIADQTSRHPATSLPITGAPSPATEAVLGSPAADDQVGDEPRPARLVRRAEPGAGVAVEVLVERDQVMPGRVALEQLVRRRRPAASRPSPLEEQAGQPACELVRDLRERQLAARPGRELDAEGIAEKAVVRRAASRPAGS